MDFNLLHFTILFILIMLLVIFLFWRKKNNPEFDFRTLFSLGICLIPVGISTENYALMVFGFLYIVLGLANKKNWKEKPDWNKLSKKQKRFKLWILSLFGLIVLGLFIFLLVFGGV